MFVYSDTRGDRFCRHGKTCVGEQVRPSSVGNEQNINLKLSIIEYSSSLMSMSSATANIFLEVKDVRNRQTEGIL